MLAASRHVTFIHVSVTSLSCVARWAATGELVGYRGTCAPICTWLRQAGIYPLAVLSCTARRADAFICVSATHLTSASMLAGARDKAQVGGGVLAVLTREAWRTAAGGFPLHGQSHTGSSILAFGPVAGIQLLAVLPQEARRTLAVSCTIVVGNTFSFIYTGLESISTLYC